MIDTNLRDAITAAARFLEKNSTWYFGTGGTDSLQTEVDEEFIDVMAKHIFPLMDHEAMLKMRVAKLHATQKAVTAELAKLGEPVDKQPDM